MTTTTSTVSSSHLINEAVANYNEAGAARRAGFPRAAQALSAAVAEMERAMSMDEYDEFCELIA